MRVMPQRHTLLALWGSQTDPHFLHGGYGETFYAALVSVHRFSECRPILTQAESGFNGLYMHLYVGYRRIAPRQPSCAVH